VNKFLDFVFLLMSIALFFRSSVLAEPAQNPIIWADVPDVAVIRVGDTYYMSSTTMHMSPGLPIMKSKDLVNWELIGYVYDTLTDNAALRLENGKSAYGAGSWASSLRYHNGTYYVSTFSSTSGKTHIYTTEDIDKGLWKETTFSPSLHDHSLFFDDDGRIYMLYGGGNLRLVELKADLTGIKPDGFNEEVIRNAHIVAGSNIGLVAEGSQMLKVNGKYYVMNITWPRGGMRTQIIHRADKITGPYEGKVILQDKGIAQGCLIDTPDGKWYAVLFQDNGSVGRSPWLVPVKWEDGWPVLGIDGKAPMMLDIDDNEEGLGNIVASDEFNRKPGEPLPLAWQWNHNPDNRYWSIGARSGYLRLTTGRVDSEVLHARNTLTQRTFGPVCSAATKIEVAHMKDGDCAGLIALQKKYGFISVKMEGESKSIVVVSAQSDIPEVVASVPLTQQTVYLKIDCDFGDRKDNAYFYYSLDGTTWTKIDTTLQMAYTLPHFMGYRFGLFNFATKSTGGFVDFDYYHISGEIGNKTVANPDPNFYVFLCFGQSNMDGAGTIEQQDKTVDTRFQVLSALDAPKLDRKKGYWYPAVPPLCRETGGLGPADYFGRTLVASLPEHIRVGVINVAIPGCKIELFEKDTYQAYAATVPPWMTNFINEYDGNPYQYLVNMAKVAQKTGVIKGILLHQGESNPNDLEWPEKVKGIYNNLIKDLNLNPDDVPLLSGETVNADQQGVCAGMNKIIAELPKTLANSYIISSAGCLSKPDRLHFNSAGNREFGKRYARKMLSLLGYEMEALASCSM
jgi:beta-xylosidase